MKDAEARCGVIKEDIFWMFRQSLRKHCDSKITSLAYNLALIDSFMEAWGNYEQLVWIELGMPNVTIPDALRMAAEDMAHGSREQNAVKLTLSMFSKDDWERAATSMV